MATQPNLSPKELKTIMEAKGMKPDRHNWLYSFMNASYTPYPVGELAAAIMTRIFLVAYCKQCDQTVSVEVPYDVSDGVKVNRAGIPKDGCDWNGE